MGQKQCSLSFHQKYKLVSRAQCILNNNQTQYILDKSLRFRVVHFVNSDRSAFNFFSKLLQTNFKRSIYRVQISDLYRKTNGNELNLLVIYPKIGINLYELVLNRSRMGRPFTEQDVNYMLQCICKGLQQLEQFQLNTFILTPLLVVFSFDWSFKIFSFILQNCTSNFQLLNSLLPNDQRNQSLFASFHQNWKYYLYKIQDIPDKKTINLLSLGLICLFMLDNSFTIENLFDSRTGQFIYAKVLSKINTIKDEKLKWKIWLLTNQYPQQRREIYNELNPNFDQLRNLLLRNTSLMIDAHYIRGQKYETIRQKKLNQQKLSYRCLNQSKNQYITNIMQSRVISKPTTGMTKRVTNIRFTFSNPPLSKTAFEDKKIQDNVSIALCPKNKETQIDRSIDHIKDIKMNSWLSDQTASSPCKKNQQAHLQKSVELDLKIVEEMETKQQRESIDEGLVQNQRQQALSHCDIEQCQQSQEGSIIQVNIEESDQQEQDEFFKDIRAKHYSIDRQIVPQPHPKSSLSQDILRDIIRQESSIEFSGQIQLESDEQIQQIQQDEILRQYEKQQMENQLLLTNLQCY